MKRRVSKVLNFFAFNLLFFALYLNFIHKDKDVHEAMRSSHSVSSHATMLVKNSETSLQDGNDLIPEKQAAKPSHEETASTQ